MEHKGLRIENSCAHKTFWFLFNSNTSEKHFHAGCKRCKFPCLKLLNADGIKKTNWCEERGMKMLELVMARTEIQPWLVFRKGRYIKDSHSHLQALVFSEMNGNLCRQAKQGKPQVPIHPFLRF
ncbi:hypothetical protein V6N12_051808 [Hibiscus sabdariffa]|uniref:Uncharacterized protein n=1 Tax=Hibiscus sabdariffa TaxID=183260 RepID=A0ABR2GGE4_9ROSI